MKGKVLGALLIGGILTACGWMTNQEEIDQIEALEKRLDPVSVRMDSIEDSLLDHYQKTITGHVDIVYKVLTPNKDSLDRKTSILLSDYARLRKKIGNTQAEIRTTERDLEYSRNQLKNLLVDLRNNKIQGGKDAFPEYLESETSALESLETNSERLLVAFNKIKKDFERWHPPMVVVIDSIENLKNTR